VQVWVNGVAVTIPNPDPTTTLLEWLREERRLTGTHVGCWEGGCGICTVTVTRTPPGAAPGSPVETVPINSCLRRLCMSDGCAITTVEGLGNKDKPHKIQSAVADGNATQCGYCTPGWVMQMYGLLEKDATPDPKKVEESFDGNLCRCTGYRPLLSAFGTFAKGGSNCGGHTSAKTPAGLLSFTASPLHFTSSDGSVELYKVLTMAQYAEAVKLLSAAGKKIKPLVANTSAGVIKYLQPQSTLEDGTGYIDVSELPDLNGITSDPSGLHVGAAVTIEALIETLQGGAADHPYYNVLAGHMLRIASVQIRSVASWAGNLMIARQFAKFDSDMVITLGAAGATFSIITADGSTKDGLGIAELLAETGTILVCSMLIPNHLSTTIIRTYKTSMRHTFAHAIVNMGVNIGFQPGAEGTVRAATVVVGGVCDQLLVATATAAAVAGQPVNTATLVAAVAALKADIARVGPSTDPRYSASYKFELAAGFLYKAFLETHQGSLPAPYSTAVQDMITAASRPISSGSVDFATVPGEGPVSTWIPKIDGLIQTTGEAHYPSDVGVHRKALCAQIVFSTSASAKLTGLDPSAALKMEGVVDFIGADAIPGMNAVNAGIVSAFPDAAHEKLFFAVGDTVPCVGAMLGVVVANSWLGARRAAKQVVQTYSSAEPVVATMAEAKRLGRTAGVPDDLPKVGAYGGGMRRGARYQFAKGVHFEKPGFDASPAAGAASAAFMAHGQRHFYMETQSALATPVDGMWEVVVSDSDCNTTQLCLAAILNVPAHKINVKCPRTGGSYGGKLTRQLISSGPAVVAAHKLGVPVQIQLERSDDLQIVAGREDVEFDYSVTYLPSGRVQEMDMTVVMDPGFVYADASGDMAMCVGFSDNCYSYSKFTVKPTTALTDTPHTTAMRAPGCMQSILASEVVMEHVAKLVNKDLDDVHEMNFYQLADNPVTPFGDHLGEDGYNWTIPEVWSQLKASSDYATRKASVAAFNAANKWRKKGIALSPVKYVMFTSYYSSGALVNVYADGTVLISTGGSELGQGLNTKVAMCAAYVLGIPLDMVSVSTRETSKVPNNTATGGSGTSESSAEATMKACQQIVERLKPYTSAGKKWTDAVAQAITDNVPLMATSWEHIVDKENTNHYATYGAAVSEVTIDVLTGEVLVDRCDILMDLGTQLDAAVDVGQVTGGFMIALGWLLSENLHVDPSGTQINAGTWEYKIPGAYDIPLELNVSLLKDSPNPVGVLGSKGCAEPAMGTMPSVYLAIKNAIYAARAEVGAGDDWFLLNTPCSPEMVREAIGPIDSRQLIVPS